MRKNTVSLIGVVATSIALSACDGLSNISSKHPREDNIQNRGDSLQRVADSLNTLLNKNKENIDSFAESFNRFERYVYAKIDFLIITQKYVPKQILIRGDEYDPTTQTYSKEISTPERWETIEQPYTFYSSIRHVGFLGEDQRYMFLDEMEKDCRSQNILNKIRIVNREVKEFTTYADASKSLEDIKTGRGVMR